MLMMIDGTAGAQNKAPPVGARRSPNCIASLNLAVSAVPCLYLPAHSRPALLPRSRTGSESFTSGAMISGLSHELGNKTDRPDENMSDGKHGTVNLVL